MVGLTPNRGYVGGSQLMFLSSMFSLYSSPFLSKNQHVSLCKAFSGYLPQIHFFLLRSFMIQFHFLPFSFPHCTFQLHLTSRAANMPQVHAFLILSTVPKSSSYLTCSRVSFVWKVFMVGPLAATRCQMTLLCSKNS